jgi:hypothetical protein
MIISIDIGLRNLAIFCASYKDKSDISTYKIEFWDIYNTLDTDSYECEGIQKSGKICGKKCSLKYKKNLVLEIEKMSTEQSIEISSEVSKTKGTANPDYIFTCKTHFPKTLDCKAKEHTFKKKNIDDYLLQDIAKNVISKIQEIYDKKIKNLNIETIIIELQPVLNKKAVFTSHIIYGKLTDLYKDANVKITFVRAVHKLKAYDGPHIECKLKGAYAQRKWLSVQYTKWFLENKFSKEQMDIWLPYFESQSVKPDLADTLLMGINGIYGIPKKAQPKLSKGTKRVKLKISRNKK